MPNFIANTSIEILNDSKPRGKIRFALFDFDGTISTFRSGWQIVMAELMIEFLRLTPHCEPLDTLTAVVQRTIDFSTGQPTVEQMAMLSEMVAERGGEALTAQAYKDEFSRRLSRYIHHRVAAVQEGKAPRETMMVPGVVPLLAALRRRGIPCYIASGSDEADVIRETGILGLADFFAGIYGGRTDRPSFSKRQVIDRLIEEHHLQPGELAGFGDGFVEIEELAATHSIAVGVASEELVWSGPDPLKRKRLMHAGADIIIPDYRDHEALIAYLFAEEEA